MGSVTPPNTPAPRSWANPLHALGWRAAWRRLIALIIKELLAVWRDPKSRFVLIVPPLVQLAVFSYAATYDVERVSLAILDDSQTQVSRELVARFKGSPSFGSLIFLDHESEIAPTIDSRNAMVALHIPADFERRLLSDPPAPVQVILDGRRSNTAQIIYGYVTTILAGFNEEQRANRALPITARPNPGALAERSWFNPNLESLWVVVPGLVAVLTQVVALVVTALSVARERELGTFEQLLVTPLRPWEIVVGKTVPAMLIGFVEGNVILLASQLWFKVPFTGSLLLLYFSLFVFLLSIIGAGLFISALSRTQQQAILGAFLFLVPAIILSGFATPIDNMPDWIQTLTLINPMRFFLTILWGLFLKDLPLDQVMTGIWPMALIALVTLSTATWLFHRKLN